MLYNIKSSNVGGKRVAQASESRTCKTHQNRVFLYPYKINQFLIEIKANLIVAY
jgi:hypothetical protein